MKILRIIGDRAQFIKAGSLSRAVRMFQEQEANIFVGACFESIIEGFNKQIKSEFSNIDKTLYGNGKTSDIVLTKLLKQHGTM